MLTEKSTRIVSILTVLLFSSTSVACPQGQGQWTLTTGGLECRPCPSKTELDPDEALKMPAGCLAPFSGALLDVDHYIDLKDSRTYAKELESWKLELAPTLDSLSAKINESTSKLEEAVDYNMTLQLDLVDARAEVAASNRAFWIVTIAGASSAILLTTALVVSLQTAR